MDKILSQFASVEPNGEHSLDLSKLEERNKAAWLLYLCKDSGWDSLQNERFKLKDDFIPGWGLPASWVAELPTSLPTEGIFVATVLLKSETDV